MTATVSASPRTWRLGTRRSPLAVAQSQTVADALEAAHPGLKVELVPIETRGDRLPGDLAPLGGKGLFTAELERGLGDGTFDLAVHSLKDLPVDFDDDLEIAAYPPRADARDVLVSTLAGDLESLPAGAVLLTGASRRRAQILALRPDVSVASVRGNVGTRLRRWKEHGAGGVILAAAGLARLGLDEVPACPLDPEAMVPAPGQGILAVQARAGSRMAEAIAHIDDPRTRTAAEAERAIVVALGGNCTLPLGAWARPVGGGVTKVTAVLGTLDGRLMARGEGAAEDPLRAAEDCLADLRANGSEDVLAALA